MVVLFDLRFQATISDLTRASYTLGRHFTYCETEFRSLY